VRVLPTREKNLYVAVSDQMAVVACETGVFWLVELNGHGDFPPFAAPMTSNGRPGSTAGLLNGAVALGFQGDEGVFRRRTASLPRYMLHLVGAYHNAGRTPGHFRKAAKRLRELDRPEIAVYLEKHAREETGHERLALKDLRELGLPAEHIVANLVPDAVRPLCELFDRLAASDYPIGCLGYSYCFESTAAMKQKSDVDALTALQPKGVSASRFLRTHSSLGSEVAHVDDLIEFIASLPAHDRIEIVKVTYETAVAMANGLRQEAVVSDSEILATLAAAAGESSDSIPV
jgi:hypothetical protein